MAYNFSQSQTEWLKGQGIDPTNLSRSQFNLKLPSGETIAAGINPGQAATLQIPTYTTPEITQKAQDWLTSQGGVLKNRADVAGLNPIGATNVWVMPDGSIREVGANFYENLGADLLSKEGKTVVQADVMGRNTPQGAAIASQFPVQNIDAQAELAKAQAQTPVVGGAQPLGQPFGSFTTQPTAQDQAAVAQNVAKAPTTPTTTTTPTTPNIYEVKSGDTLSAIAARNGMTLSQLLANNPQFQANPNLIYPGQQVNLGTQAATGTTGTTSTGKVLGQYKGQDILEGQDITARMKEIDAGQPTVDGQTENANNMKTAADAGVAMDSTKITTKNPDGTTKSLMDMVKEVSQAMGINSITEEIAKIDASQANEAMEIDSNPWISEAERGKRQTLLRNKYETKRNALIERLKLQDSMVGKAIDYYEAERKYQQEMLFKSMDIAQKELDRDVEEQKIIASAKSGGLTPAQINSTINTIASQFDNEGIVKNFGIISEAKSFVDSLPNQTTNPADDQALIYSLAKALDPGSVVREGEYATVQRYSQSMIDSYGKSVSQALAGTGFLSETARANIKNTISSRYQASLSNYNNLRTEYQRQIDDARAGNPRTITQYATQTADNMTNPPADVATAALDSIVDKPLESWLDGFLNVFGLQTN